MWKRARIPSRIGAWTQTDASKGSEHALNIQNAEHVFLPRHRHVRGWGGEGGAEERAGSC